MVPARVDIETWTNADYVEEFVFSTDGVAVDLTGYSFDLDIKATKESGSALDEFTTVGAATTEGIYPSDPSDGIIQVRIEKEAIAAIFTALEANYSPATRIGVYFDFIVTLPGGDIESWMHGVIFVNKGITNV